MSGGELAFSVGDRVAFQNVGYLSLGTVTAKLDDGKVVSFLVEWDDGYEDIAGSGYLSGDLLRVDRPAA